MATESYQYGSILKVTSGGTVAVGREASTDGTYNTCVGCEASGGGASGNNNVAIGYQSAGSPSGGGTAIGAGASITVSGGATTSLAIGYGASTTHDNVCVLGAQTDECAVVEYGPHFGFHAMAPYYEEYNYTRPGPTETITAAAMLDGLMVYMKPQTITFSNYPLATPPVADVIALIPNCRVGTAWYFKLALYQSRLSLANLSLTFGTNWIVKGSQNPQRIPKVTSGKFQGCKNFLCVVTAITPTPQITVFCVGGPTT